jgi:hypothetical protein
MTGDIILPSATRVSQIAITSLEKAYNRLYLAWG